MALVVMVVVIVMVVAMAAAVVVLVLAVAVVVAAAAVVVLGKMHCISISCDPDCFYMVLRVFGHHTCLTLLCMSGVAQLQLKHRTCF